MSSTTRFERLLEAVPDALVGMDQKGVIRFVNRQTESLFDYDRDDLIGEPIEMLLPEPLWQIYASHREDYFTDPRTRSSGLDLELSGRSRDGKEFPVNISLSHIDTGDVLLVITAVSDVSERRQAFQDAQRMSAIIENSGDAIIGKTLGGTVTSWNPAAERMYGYTGREIIGRSIRVLAPQDRTGEIDDILAAIRAGESVGPFETMRVRKDGTALAVSISVAPIRDEGGNLVGASGIHRDVTEQRKAFEVAQRMAAIVANSNDAIIARTLEGIVTSWNPAAERLYGYTSEEMVGQHIDRLVPDDRASQSGRLLGGIKAGASSMCFETTYVRKDGTVVPVSTTISPIRDEGGNLVGASAIHRDMTEQEHAARYARSLIEAGLDPLVTISPEGKILDINEATVKITGLPREALIGSDSAQYVVEPDRGSELFQQVFERGSVTDFPMTVRHRDGTLTDVLANASVYRGLNGDVLGVLASGHVTRQS